MASLGEPSPTIEEASFQADVPSEITSSSNNALCPSSPCCQSSEDASSTNNHSLDALEVETIPCCSPLSSPTHMAVSSCEDEAHLLVNHDHEEEIPREPPEPPEVLLHTVLDGTVLEEVPMTVSSYPPVPLFPTVTSSRPKSLMETLLVAKMDRLALGASGNADPSVSSSRLFLSGSGGRTLMRTDSVNSDSSLGSLASTATSVDGAKAGDLCKCDDCLLGIADLYVQNAAQDGSSRHRKKPSPWRKLRNIVQWTPFFQTYKKQRYPWVQLAGHQGNFKAGPDQGTILKKLCEKEEKCFKVLMKDILRPYVPEYRGLVTSDDGECSYLQLQDLLGDFVSPCVMDCKIGVRTYLEEELAKAKEKSKLRKDMYDKMCQIDPNAPTDDEHRLKGVTKPRYMVWRETISSTETLGFRIEGIRRGDGTSSKDFKTTKSKDQVMEAFVDFSQGFLHAVPKYIQRLKAIKATLESSKFFKLHEVIGSSLLFVHDRNNANVWLIDFAKTIRLPEDIDIDHSSKWKVGNHEDGYLIGVNNLISIFMSVLEKQPLCITPPPLNVPDKNDNRSTADHNENDDNTADNNDNIITDSDNIT